jgi:glycosyltransferase EpsD
LREERGWKDNEFIVLQVNNLKPGKNNMALLEVARIVIESAPHCRFYIAGDGPDRARLEQFIQDNQLDGHCFLMGWRRDVPELIFAADVVSLTTRYSEGLPQACSQGMAVGRPLVMYDCEGVREEVHDGENGFLIPMDGVETMAKSITCLALDPALTQQMGERSFALLNREHEVSVMVQKLDDLYSNPFR